VALRRAGRGSPAAWEAGLRCERSGTSGLHPHREGAATARRGAGHARWADARHAPRRRLRRPARSTWRPRGRWSGPGAGCSARPRCSAP